MGKISSIELHFIISATIVIEKLWHTSAFFAKKIIMSTLLSSKREHNYSRKNTICVFAQPRGGSTWFTNLLLNIPKSLKVDEPLSRGMFDPDGDMPTAGIGKLKELDMLNFYYHQPIPKGVSFPEAEHFFDALFKLKFRNPYLFEETSLKSMWRPELLIFKFNQGNLLMDWLIDKFDFTPIVLLRNPYAVIASQLSFYAFDKVRGAEKYEIPEFRFCEYFDTYKPILKSLNHPEEMLAARWCMNYLPVRGYNDKWLTVHYENLITDSEAEMKRVFTYLGRDIPQSMASKFYQPAFKNHRSKTFYHKQESKDNWKSKLTDLQIERINRVLKAFDVTSYNGENII